MNGTQLKILAILTMTIDHVGAVLYPEVTVLRLIGRLAFPIFAFLLVEGYVHTRDVKKYLIRLWLFALISEIPYDLAFDGVLYAPLHQNIFFTLGLALLGLWTLDRFKDTDPVIGPLVFVLLCVVSLLLRTDYNIFGMATVFLFHRYRGEKIKALYAVALLHLAYGVMDSGLLDGAFILRRMIQSAAAVSVLFIGLYNGEKGRSFKYVFYVFYPLHLTLLWLVDYFQWLVY